MVDAWSGAACVHHRSIDPIISGSRLQIDALLYATIVSIRSLKRLFPLPILRASLLFPITSRPRNVQVRGRLSAEFRRPILIANSRIWSRRGTFTTITLLVPPAGGNSRVNRELQNSRSSARCLRDKFNVEKLNLRSRGRRRTRGGSASVHPLHRNLLRFLFFFVRTSWKLHATEMSNSAVVFNLSFLTPRNARRYTVDFPFNPRAQRT